MSDGGDGQRYFGSDGRRLFFCVVHWQPGAAGGGQSGREKISSRTLFVMMATVIGWRSPVLEPEEVAQ